MHMPFFHCLFTEKYVLYPWLYFLLHSIIQFLHNLKDSMEGTDHCHANYWDENLIIVLCQHNWAFKSSQFPLQPKEILWWKALSNPLKLCPLMFYKCLQPQWLFLSSARIAAASSFCNSNQWLQQQRTFASPCRHSQQLMLVSTLQASHW